jgi:hypothetical protein
MLTPQNAALFPENPGEHFLFTPDTTCRREDEHGNIRFSAPRISAAGFLPGFTSWRD